MRILINDKNEILGYSEVGTLEGDFEISDELVSEVFINDFDAGKYLWKDNQIITNPDYKVPAPPVAELTETDDTASVLIGQLSAQVLGLESKIASLESELKK